MIALRKLFIALVVMMVAGVQAYAQPQPRHRSAPHTQYRQSTPRPRYHQPAPRPRYHQPTPRPRYHQPAPRPRYHTYYRYAPLRYVWYPRYRYYYYRPFNAYLYDSYERPSKIRIGDLEFRRTSSGQLRIRNGHDPAVYVDVYQYNQLRYTNGTTEIIVVTQRGSITITVTDGQDAAEYIM